MEKFLVRFQHFLKLESVLYVKSKRFIPYAQCKQVYVCSLFVGKPGYLGGILGDNGDVRFCQPSLEKGKARHSLAKITA